MSVKVVSPRLLRELARAPEDVLVIYELGLVGLYAGLSKLFRPHQVISLVEGDYRHSGRDRQCLPQGRRPSARRALRRRLRGQQPIRSGVPDPNAQRSRGEDHRRLVAGRPAGRPRGASPGRGTSPRGGAAVRLRRPAHPPEGDRPGDPRAGGLPAAVRPLRPVDHRRRPGTAAPGRAQPSARRRGRGHLPRDGGPPDPQRRLPGLSGVRVPDPPGPDRPRRGGGPERGRAGGGVADDGSGRDDRARRRERDRGRPDGRVGAGRGDAPSRRSGDVARSPRGRPADQRGPAPGGSRPGAAARRSRGHGRPRREGCEASHRPESSAADQTEGQQCR